MPIRGRSAQESKHNRRQLASGTFFREAAHDAEDRCEGRRDRWLLGSPRFTARLNLAGVSAFSRSSA